VSTDAVHAASSRAAPQVPVCAVDQAVVTDLADDPPPSGQRDGGAIASALERQLVALETYQGHDIEANLAAAAALEQDAERLGEMVRVRRARLVRADMEQRQGQVAEAARTFLEVHRWAEVNDCVALRARSHFHLALTYHYLGDESASLEHAVASVELLDEEAPPQVRILHLIRLANALANAGSLDAARLRYAQAEQMAIAVGDLTRQLLILNNLAYTEYESGQLALAQVVVSRMHGVARALGRDFLIVERDTIANIQIAAGEYAAAEETVQAAADAPRWFEVHDFADAALTLAVAQRLGGALDRASSSLRRCRALCDKHNLAGVRVRALAEQAELSAATGDFRAAFREYKEFHVEAERLRSTQQEAQARTRQVLFEIAEARRDARRYHEQARRDPLTALFNRRYVDEALPDVLANAARQGAPVTVALVDLDHFKRVNDTFSHDTGDRVLTTTAQLLDGHCRTLGSGFAARMGGEEFLLVLPGRSSEQAHRDLDDLRRLIGSHPWHLVAAGVRVTASIGAVVLAPGADIDVRSLLADADRNLYLAKDTGRDRIVL
jgi:diguanylate cyclase (GGDEF)-like protein